MNDQQSRHGASAGVDRLQLRKLELEIAEAEFRQKLLEHKEQLEIDKLQQEILASKIENDSKQRMAGFDTEKATLDLQEKKRATRYALPPAVWDILKYAVAVIPIVLTGVGIYIGYQKDTQNFRHQVELEQKFKVDKQVVELLKNLGDDKNPLEVMHAALALQSYGRPAIRLLVPHLRVNHPNWLIPFFVELLIDVVANEPDATKQKQAADELVERIVDQAILTITEFTEVPTEFHQAGVREGTPRSAGAALEPVQVRVRPPARRIEKAECADKRADQQA